MQMDEKLKGLQENIDKTISKDHYFTEQDKRGIRSGINKMKSGTSTKRPIFNAKVAHVHFHMCIPRHPRWHHREGTRLISQVNRRRKWILQCWCCLQSLMSKQIMRIKIISSGTVIRLIRVSGEAHYQDIKGNTVIWSGSDKIPDSDSSSFDFDLSVYNLNMEQLDETFQSEMGGEITDGQVNDDWITWVDLGTVDDEYGWRIYALNRNTKEKNLIRFSNQVAGYANPHVGIPQLSMSTGDEFFDLGGTCSGGG